MREFGTLTQRSSWGLFNLLYNFKFREGWYPALLLDKVCVHGFPEFWYVWRHQLRHFSARGYRVVALDIRGYGDSDKPVGLSKYHVKVGDSSTSHESCRVSACKYHVKAAKWSNNGTHLQF